MLKIKFLVITFLTTIGLIAIPTAASATTDTCPPDPWWQTSNVATSHKSGVPTVYGDPGVHISIALTAGVTVTATATVTGTVTLSAIIANTSASVGVSMSVALTAQATYTGGYTVPATAQYGWIGAGAETKTYSWSKWQYVGCVGKRIAYGTAVGPYRLPYFWKGFKA